MSDLTNNNSPHIDLSADDKNVSKLIIKYVVNTIPNKKGERDDWVFDTTEAIYDKILSKKLKSVFELIHSHPIKAYIDIDRNLSNDISGYPSNILRTSLLSNIRSILKKNDFNHDDYYLFDSSNNKKLSFRIIFTNIYFNSGLDMRAFVESLNLSDVDYSVYKASDKHQLLRIPYVQKGIENRRFKLVKEDDSLAEITEISAKQFSTFFVNNIDGATLSTFQPPIKEVKLKAEPSPTSTNTTNKHVEKTAKIKKEAVEDLVNLLLDDDGKQIDNFDWDYWHKVMWCLRNIADNNGYDLRETAHRFSKEKITYDETTTDIMYDTSENFNRTPLNIGSLRKMVKDTLTTLSIQELYENWVKKYFSPNPLRKLMNSSFMDADIADYFTTEYKNRYIYYEKTLYKYEGYWRKTGDNEIFRELEKLYITLSNFANSVYLGKTDNEEEIKENLDKHKDTISKLTQLRRLDRMKAYVQYILIRFTVEEDIFDNNGWILVFLNKTLDLKTGLFRENTPTDYCSKPIPYDFEETTTTRITNLMSKIMPLEDEREFLLKCLATTLIGETQENFIVLTGEGGNGKDTLMTCLMKAVLGDLYYEGNETTLTDELRGDLSVSISSMDKKRCVIFNEPKKAIKTAMMKKLTGGDNIAFRGLYSKKAQTTLHASNFMLCNKKPHLDEVGEAIARRLIVIPFRSLFRDKDKMKEYSEDAKYLYEGDRYYKTKQFANDYKLEMMNLLISHLNIIRKDAFQLLNTPQTIKNLAKEYMDECDEIYGWFCSTYEKSDDADDFIQTKDIYQAFKESDFYKDLNKSTRRQYTKEKLINEIRSNHNLRLFFKERHTYRENGKKKEAKNALLRFKMKSPETDDSDYE